MALQSQYNKSGSTFNQNAYQMEGEHQSQQQQQILSRKQQNQNKFNRSTPQFFPKSNEINEKDKLNTISKIYNNQYSTKRSEKRLQRKYPESLDKRQSPTGKYEQYGSFSQTYYGQFSNNSQSSKNSNSNLNGLNNSTQYKFFKKNQNNHLSTQHLIKNNFKERDNNSQSKIDKVNLINSIYNKDFGKPKPNHKNFTYQRHFQEKKNENNINSNQSKQQINIGSISQKNSNKSQNLNLNQNQNQSQQHTLSQRKPAQQFQPYKSDQDFNKKIGKKIPKNLNLNQIKKKIIDMTPKSVISRNKNISSQYNSPTRNMSTLINQNISQLNGMNNKSNRESNKNNTNRQIQQIISRDNDYANSGFKNGINNDVLNQSKNKNSQKSHQFFEKSMEKNDDENCENDDNENNKQIGNNLFNFKHKKNSGKSETNFKLDQKQFQEENNFQNFFNNNKKFQSAIQTSQNIETLENQSEEKEQNVQKKNNESKQQKQSNSSSEQNILNRQLNNQISNPLDMKLVPSESENESENQNKQNIIQQDFAHKNSFQKVKESYQYDEESFEQYNHPDQNDDEFLSSSKNNKQVKKKSDKKNNKLTKDIMEKVQQIQVNRPKTSEGGRRRLKRIKQQNQQQKNDSNQIQNLQEQNGINNDKIHDDDNQNQINENNQKQITQNQHNMQSHINEGQQKLVILDEIPNSDQNLLANSINPQKNFKNYKYSQSQNYNKNDWYRNDFYRNKPQSNFFKTTNDFSTNQYNQQNNQNNHDDLFYGDEGGIEFQIIEEDDVQINQVDPQNLSHLQDSQQKSTNNNKNEEHQQTVQKNRDIYSSINNRNKNQNKIIIRHNKSAYGKKKIQKNQDNQQPADFKGSTLASDFLQLFA